MENNNMNTIQPEQARPLIKAINRRCRQGKLFGRDRYGADFNTWAVTHPQIAQTYCQAARILTGREGRFMPPVFGAIAW